MQRGDQNLYTERFTLTAGTEKTLPVVGEWFEVLYCSIADNPYVSIGHGPYYEIAAGITKRVKPFERITFRNNSASTMTLWVLVSDHETWDNRMILAAVAAGLFIPIDDTSNGIETPAAIVVLPKAGFLIDVNVPVNKGGGEVGIPVTSQPFTYGEPVTITGCPQYNGNYGVAATSSANEVVITATFKGGLINNAAAVDKGGGKVGIPITGHPYATGETIRIANTVNYNGDFAVDATSTVNEVVITHAYVAETFDGVNDSHNLVFDGVNDKIKLTVLRSIAASATRKELHLRNHDATYKVFFGQSTVDATTYQGLVIEPESTYILTYTGIVYLDTEAGTGKTGAKLSWGNFTKT